MQVKLASEYANMQATAWPEAAILDWYGHCGVNKLGESGGMLPQENF